MAHWVKLTQADRRDEPVWVNIDLAEYMQRETDSGLKHTVIFFPSHLVKVVETPPEIGRLMREKLTKDETQ